MMGAGIPEDFLRNIAEDDSPQLGGNLDCSGYPIVSINNLDIAITPHGTGAVILKGLSWPTADGSLGDVLTTDGAGGLTFEPPAAGGLTAVVDDLSPQLGGNLDVNGNIITSASDGHITITPDGTGEVYLGSKVNIAGDIAATYEPSSGITTKFFDGVYRHTGDTAIAKNCLGWYLDQELSGTNTGTAEIGYGVDLLLDIQSTLNNPALNAAYRGVTFLGTWNGTNTQSAAIDLVGGYFQVAGSMGTGGTTQRGVVGSALGTADSNYGGFFAAQNATNNYGVYASAGDIAVATDGGNLLLGASDDAAIFYDGADLNIDPRAVGTGHLLLCPNQGKVGIRVAVPAEALDIAGDLRFDQVAEVTLAQAQAIVLTEDPGAGTLAAGEWHYDFYFITDEGSTSSIQATHGTDEVPDITVSANAAVDITNIPISPDAKVTSRGIMRVYAVDGNAQNCQLIHTLNDNTTTSWTDDGSLSGSGAWNYQKPNSTAGTIKINNDSYLKGDKYNYFVGYRAGQVNESYGNIGVGGDALRYNTTGSDTTAVGYLAGWSHTTGNSNVFVGNAAGYWITNGRQNTIIGSLAYGEVSSTNLLYTTAVGGGAIYNGPGLGDHYNSVFGARAGSNFAGLGNVLFGFDAAHPASRVTGSSYNVVIGYSTGLTLGSGASYNILIGPNLEPDSTTGSYQLSIGDLLKGDMTSGSEYLSLPYDEPFYFGTAGDASIQYDGTDLILDAQVVGSGAILLGPNSATKIGVRVAAPTEALDIAGDLNFDRVTGLTVSEAQAITLTEDAGGGTLAAGEWHYDFYFITDEGDTSSIYVNHGIGEVPDITVSANAAIDIDNIPISSDPRVTGRGIMRVEIVNQVGYICRPMHIINDNTTTSWTDTGALTPSGPLNYQKPNDTAGRIRIDGDQYVQLTFSNTYIGKEAGKNDAGSYGIVGIGQRALWNLTIGEQNVGIGPLAGGLLTTGGQNTFLGQNAGYFLVNGDANICIGNLTYGLNGSSGNNAGMVLIGHGAGYQGPGTNHHGSICLGRNAGAYVGGGDNIFIGRNVADHTSTRISPCYYNVIIGSFAGTDMTAGADYNILIGYNAELDTSNGDYQINIGGVFKGNATSGSEEMSFEFDEPFYLGVTKDASITYDGTDLIINPLEQGTGFLKLLSPFEVISGTTGGHKWNVAEATATLSGATTDIQVNVPAGAKILGCQLRVDTAITSGDGGTDWDADYTGGSTQSIGATLAFAKQTKQNALYDANAASPIASAEVDVRCTCNAGTFNAGVVRAIVYYEELDTMADAA